MGKLCSVVSLRETEKTNIKILKGNEIPKNSALWKKLSIPTKVSAIEESVWGDIDLVATKDNMPIAVISCKLSLHGRFTETLFYSLLFKIITKVKFVLATPDAGRGQSGYWVLKGVYKKRARKIRNGDKAVAYIKFFSAIFGVVEITSDPYHEDTTSVLGESRGFYPIRFKIKPELFLKEPTSIRPLIKRLDFIQNEEKWYSYFQTSIRKIGKKDFDLILSHLKEKAPKEVNS